MAQRDFWGTKNDSRALLSTILHDTGLYIIPDLYYAQQAPTVFHEFDEKVFSVLSDRPNMFIGGNIFTRYPPSFHRIPGGANQGLFTVDVSQEGPFMQLTLPGYYEENGVYNLAPGMLSIQSQYFNPLLQQWERPSPSIKKAFRSLSATFAKSMVQRTLGEPIWMGSDAVDQYENHHAIVHAFGKQWQR